MTTYPFETMTPDQAAAFAAADTLVFTNSTATAGDISVNYEMSGASLTGVVVTETIEGQSHSLTFGPDVAGFEAAFTSGGSLLYIGGRGDDAMPGLADKAFGGPGADTLNGANTDAYLQGNQGDDLLIGGAGGNTMYGGQGDDSIVGGANFNEVSGNQGDDSIVGGADFNQVNGNQGDDTIVGHSGIGDWLRGGQGDDVIHSGAANDWISGDLGNNTIYGGQGMDTIHAGAGHDYVNGWHAGDQVLVDSGVTYTVTQVGADVRIAFSNAGEMDLLHTQQSSLGAGWISGGQLITPPPPPPPPSYGHFTTGRDALSTTDGAHVYTATLGGATPTLTANDSLHGNGNTLAITDSSSATSTDMLPSGLSLTGVAAVTLTTLGNAGVDASHPFDLSAFTGISQFTLTASGNDGDYLKVGGGVAIAIDSPSATVSVTATGAGSLALTDASLTSLQLAGDISLASSASPFLIVNHGATILGLTDDAAVHLSVGIAGAAGAAGGGVGGSAAGVSITLGGGGDSVILGETGGDGGDGGPAPGLVGLTGGAGGVGGVGGALTLGDGDNTVTIGSVGGNGGNGGAGLNNAADGADVSGGAGGTGGAGGHQTITLGDGDNVVTDNSQGGAGGLGGNATITQIGATGDAFAGNGGDGGDGGHNTITVGDGDNTITDSSSGGLGGRAGFVSNSGAGFAVNGVDGLSGAGGHDVITVGTGYNHIDLNGHVDTVIVGADANFSSDPFTPNAVIENAAAGDVVKFSGIPALSYYALEMHAASSPSDLIAQLENDLAGIPMSAVAEAYGGNTYIVASTTGIPGQTDTTIVEIEGSHGITIPGDWILLVS